MEDNLNVMQSVADQLLADHDVWPGAEVIDAAKWTVAAVSLDITDADNDRD